jgi:hypothetical protein
MLLASIVEATGGLLRNYLLHKFERRTFLGLRNYALYQSPYLPARNHARSDNCRVHLKQEVDNRISGRDLVEALGCNERQERYFVHELLARIARHVVLEAQLRWLKLDTEVDGHDLRRIGRHLTGSQCATLHRSRHETPQAAAGGQDVLAGEAIFGQRRKVIIVDQLRFVWREKTHPIIRRSTFV